MIDLSRVVLGVCVFLFSNFAFGVVLQCPVNVDIDGRVQEGCVVAGDRSVSQFVGVERTNYTIQPRAKTTIVLDAKCWRRPKQIDCSDKYFLSKFAQPYESEGIKSRRSLSTKFFRDVFGFKGWSAQGELVEYVGRNGVPGVSIICVAARRTSRQGVLAIAAECSGFDLREIHDFNVVLRRLEGALRTF